MDRNLVDELGECAWFLEKIRTRKDYAQNVYAALCNMRWQPAEVIPILKDEYWTCSWRSAGGIVADFENTIAKRNYALFDSNWRDEEGREGFFDANRN